MADSLFRGGAGVGDDELPPGYKWGWQHFGKKEPGDPNDSEGDYYIYGPDGRLVTAYPGSTTAGLSHGGRTFKDYAQANREGEAASSKGGGIFFGAGPQMTDLAALTAAIPLAVGAAGIGGAGFAGGGAPIPTLGAVEGAAYGLPTGAVEAFGYGAPGGFTATTSGIPTLGAGTTAGAGAGYGLGLEHSLTDKVLGNLGNYTPAANGPLHVPGSGTVNLANSAGPLVQGTGAAPGPPGLKLPQTPPNPKTIDKLKDKGAELAVSAGARALLNADGTEVVPPGSFDQEGVKRRVSDVFTSLQPQFLQEEEELAGATRDYHGAELKKREDEARRQLKFGAARSGNVNSPIYAENVARLEEDRALGGTRIGEASQRAVNELRAARESARSNALNLALSGTGDEAVNALTVGTQNALNAAKAANKDDLFFDLFDDLTLARVGADQGARTDNLAQLVAATKQRLGLQPFNVSDKGKGPRIIST